MTTIARAEAGPTVPEGIPEDIGDVLRRGWTGDGEYVVTRPTRPGRCAVCALPGVLYHVHTPAGDVDVFDLPGEPHAVAIGDCELTPEQAVRLAGVLIDAAATARAGQPASNRPRPTPGEAIS